jgi:hypothetical protein
MLFSVDCETAHAYTLDMNKLSIQERAKIIGCLVEGNSLRATSRMTGVAFNTVLKLVGDAGRACSAYQDKVFRNLKCKRIQCDETWAFVYAKDKNVPEHLRGTEGIGSVWTWLGVFLSMFLPSGPWWGLASKLLMVCFGLIGWAGAICFVQRKKLHCGGTVPISDIEWPDYAKRYCYGGMYVISGFTLATIGILGAANSTSYRICGMALYFCSLPTTFAVLVGEIGWGDPWKFAKMFVSMRLK